MDATATAKPVVVGKIDDDCGFIDKVNSLVVLQGDREALTQAILWAFRNKPDLAKIGQRGYEMYQERYSARVNSDKIKSILYENSWL